MKPRIAKVTLPADWIQSEKGNTMLAGDDGAIAAWIHIKDNVYLEVTDTPDNNPRLHVTFIEATQEALEKAIREQCEGWYCVRWNLSTKAPIDDEGRIT